MQEIPTPENLANKNEIGTPIASETSLSPEEETREMEFAKSLSSKVKEIGGKAFIVGGYARDEALRRLGQKIESKDIDIEVYGIEIDKLIQILGEDFKDFGPADQVGKAFGVIKIGQVDVSLPRTDSKIGSGHRGFEVKTDPYLSIEKATKRRDLTINSILLDPLTGELIDPFGGQRDLEARVLRATDLQTFSEDPLRTLRLASFAARFGFRVEEQTANLARQLPLAELPKARIGEEWRKMLLKSTKPSVGLEVARDLKIIEKLHPELAAIIGLEQEPDFHPEGDVWTHSLMTVDVASEIVERENLEGEDALVIKFSALLHDLGKATTTERRIVHGVERITSYNHEEEGITPARNFLSQMEFGQNLIDRVLPLIRNHMYLSSNQNPTENAVRRLSTRLNPASIQELAWVMEADRRGRGGLPSDLDKIINLVDLAQKASVLEEQQKPIILGRDLIEIGMQPGKIFGQIIREVQESFLDGKIKTKEEALELANQLRQDFEKSDN
jgi:tRNA nucleotidyltransferase (CCA-adding enzyme)